MMFYGRDQERRSIHRTLNRDGQSVTLVLGRRRVGKSELVKQCLRESPMTSIYFECKQTTELNNVASLATLMSETLGFPRPSLSGIEEALDLLFKTSLERDLILVLDEYPYLRETVNGLDSILQSLVDKYQDTSHMNLILCGSYIDVMKSLLEARSPLFGRIDLTVALQPMDYRDSALFYPSFSNADKVRLFSVFGGIPYYNRLVDPALSVRENIINLVTMPGARLENEIPLRLSAELSKITNANEAFEALAQGYSRFSDILAQSHVSSSPTLADVLDKLIRMELVQKQPPINDEHNKRKTAYCISDNLTLFYYRYAFKYASQLSVMDPEYFFDRYVAGDFETNYVPHAFEEVCRQYLVRQNRLGNLPEPFEKIGRYHYDDPKTRTNGEFDVVTYDRLGYIFYEAKFRSTPVDDATVRQEISQVEATGLNCYKYGFFSRSGFTATPGSQTVFIDLDEMYR